MSRHLQSRRNPATIRTMKTEDILAEIHRTREKQAAECSFDPKQIGARMRARQKENAARGVHYANFAEAEACIVREEPPKR
jgi:hypothetical protein